MLWCACNTIRLVLVVQVTLYSMFVAIMAFNAKISDPRIGGSYMTLLNTVANLGGRKIACLSYINVLNSVK